MAEFVAATLGNSLQQREDFLRGLFQRFDSNNDQQITAGAQWGGVGWLAPCVPAGLTLQPGDSQPRACSLHGQDCNLDSYVDAALRPSCCCHHEQTRCSSCWRALG